MKRILLLICTAAILLTGILLPTGVFADGDHPITLTITCDPVPELEGDGTIPSLLFTIRNESDQDYLLENAKLSGGYENREMLLDERITVLAGDKKEFTLTDVPVTADQLDTEIFYTLSWEETETSVDEETGDATFITHKREAIASLLIERFVVPELSVFALCEDERVRANDTFTVDYTIKNDTDFDMSGLKLYDPEQNMQTIALESNELVAGESVTVSVEYTMGTQDMTFRPRLEYIARRREMVTLAENTLTVESVVVDLKISVQPYPATADGTDFAVTIKNAGNKTLTDIQLFDEINTPIDAPFDLAADQVKTIHYSVKPAVSSDRIRSVRFHVTAVDCFDAALRVDDTNAYEILPYVASDDVRLSLAATLQTPYYDENKKLCAAIQFHIRYSGEMKIRNAVLTELTLFGRVVEYEELRNGDRYYTQTYQLDGIDELRFRIDAIDPAGQTVSSETIRLDLSGLREQADKKPDRIYVQPTNPYTQDLDAKFTAVLRTVLIIGLIVAAVCAVVCIALFAVELSIRKKLPAEFEEDLERAMRSTKRRTEKQLFSDSPTERFGYTAPIKLRNYGELTEEEAKARREAYERGMRENMRREGIAAANAPKPQPAPVHPESDGTRVMPTAKPNAATGRIDRPVTKPNTATGRIDRPVTKPNTATGRIDRPQPVPVHTESDGTRVMPTAKPNAATGRIDRPVTKPNTATGRIDRPQPVPVHTESDGTRVTPTAKPNAATGRIDRPVTKPNTATGRIDRPQPLYAESDGTRVMPTAKPNAATGRIDKPVTKPDTATGRIDRPQPVHAESDGTRVTPTAKPNAATGRIDRPQPAHMESDGTRVTPTPKPHPTPAEAAIPLIHVVSRTVDAAEPVGTDRRESAPKPDRVPKPEPGNKPVSVNAFASQADAAPASSYTERPASEDAHRTEEEQQREPQMQKAFRPAASWEIDPMTSTEHRPAPKNPPVRTIWHDTPDPASATGATGSFVFRRPANAELKTSEPDSLANSAPMGFRVPEPIPVFPPKTPARNPALSTQDGQGESEPTVGDADPGVPHDGINAPSEPEDTSPDGLAQDVQGESEPTVGDGDPGVPQETTDVTVETTDNPPDSLRLPPSLTQGGQGDEGPQEVPDILSEPKDNPPDGLAQDVQGESERTVGDADPGVPCDNTDVTVETTDNPPDSLRLPSSLTQGGQGDEGPQEVPDILSEPENTPPDSLVQDVQEGREPTVGDADPGVPQETTDVTVETMDNPPDSLRLPPSLTQGGQGDEDPQDVPDVPPEPTPAAQVGPRVLQEKPLPDKRPLIVHPIIRMNG